MKPAQAIALVLLILMVAWGTLFFTILTTAEREGQALAADKVLLDQDTVILKAQHQTQADLESKINGLQSHVDCLFNLATQPSHSSAFISDASSCQITTPSGSVSSGIPNQATKPSSSSSNANVTPAPTPSPQPSHPLACTLTLKLLGCKE